MEAISANDGKRAENGAGNTVLFPARFAFVSQVEKRCRDFGRRADKKRKTRILRVFLLSYPTKIDTAVAGVLSAAYVFGGFEKSITMVIYALSKISDC